MNRNGLYILYCAKLNILHIGITRYLEARVWNYNGVYSTQFDLIHWQGCYSQRDSTELESRFKLRLSQVGLNPVQGSSETFHTKHPELFEDILIVDVLE